MHRSSRSCRPLARATLLAIWLPLPALAQSLVGEWDCALGDPGIYTYRVGYAEDGRYEKFLISNGIHDGQEVSVDLLVSGRWSISGGALREWLDRVSVETLYLGSRDVTRSPDGAPLRARIEGMTGEIAGPAPIRFAGPDRFATDGPLGGAEGGMVCDRVEILE